MALSGLVSYGSSDESETESENVSQILGPSVALKKHVNGAMGAKCQKLDLDNLIDDSVVDDPVVGPTVPITLGLPEPKYTGNEELEPDSVSTGIEGVSKGLSALPRATASKEMLKSNQDDEVEEEFKKLPKNVRLPKPPKKLGKVKIALPALPTDDSDEDEPKAKKPKVQSSAGKSGLIGMLPQPKHVAVKETNRPLVPHTLSKKSAQSPIAAKSTKPATTKLKLVDAGSDSEDESEGASNFFTFNDKSMASGTNSGVGVAPIVEAGPKVEDRSDAPLSFKGCRAPPSGSSVTHHRANSTYDGVEHSETQPYKTQTPDFATGYEQPSDRVYGDAADFGPSTSAIDFEMHQKLLQDEQFKRMVGKNFRGEEIMDIMDVNADDQMSSHIEMTKTLTEEKSTMSYSKKHKDMPSHLSRRKHQITYLAFQAKERELELKNQWSQNKTTKRQTQAKYGF